MMDVSLDTDIVIHLYKSDKKDLLFTSFNKLYIHEFLLENEIRNKSNAVYIEFLSDVDKGKVHIIKNKDLIGLGVKSLFDSYKEEYYNLFDLGELHAVALAKTMGIEAFTSDDTKEYGPHYLLVRQLIEDVIPFAFYELLFLKFLSSEITIDEVHNSFQQINLICMGNRPMNFKNRMLSTAKRFTKKYGTKRDLLWIYSYCNEKGVNFNNKMKELKSFLKTMEEREL